DAGDLLGGHDGDGERPFLGGGDLLVEPAALEHPDIEKAQRCAVHLERISGSLLVVAQVEEILPYVFRAEQFGRLMIVSGKSPDGSDVAMDGGGGVVAQLQLLDHSFADGGHTVNSFRSLVYPSAWTNATRGACRRRRLRACRLTGKVAVQKTWRVHLGEKRPNRGSPRRWVEPFQSRCRHIVTNLAVHIRVGI